MKALLGQLKKSVVEGVKDAFTVVYINVLGLTLAHFLLPKMWIGLCLDYLYAWLMSDKTSVLWLVILTVAVVFKCTVDIVFKERNNKDKETT